MDGLDWQAPLGWFPPGMLDGQWTRLERLRAEHAGELWRAMDGAPDVWRWLPDGPFETGADYAVHIARQARSDDPAFYAIRGEAGWSGVGAAMRIDRANGVIEIGHLCFAPGLQRSRAATEAIFLMADHAFAHGFRRLEWKCNARNLPSRRAARRLGFAYEGTFRQAGIFKGENRDTAWFATLDGEWPVLRGAFEIWLARENFDAGGRQRRGLSGLVEAAAARLGRPDLNALEGLG